MHPFWGTAPVEHERMAITSIPGRMWGTMGSRVFLDPPHAGGM